jgi:uncharacterized membrane-anchored protein YjiN (DUF445 family)
MRTRNIATLSLITMGIGFITTLFLPDNAIIQLLKGGFEAGLVGGFADWFAVTALFRHPLGIPIPHTSLLLKNRDKIANSLISALNNELLNKDSITGKLKQFQLLKIIGLSVMRFVGKRSNRISVIQFLQTIVAKLPLESVATVIQKGIVSMIRDSDVKPLAEKLLHRVVQNDWDEHALDYALMHGSVWINKPETGQMLGSIAHQKISEYKVGGFMGFAVQAFAGFMNEEKLGTMIQQLLLSGINDLIQPDSPNREKLIFEIRHQLQKLSDDEELLNQGKRWLIDKAEHPDSGVLLLERLEAVRDSLLDSLEKEKSSGGKKVVTSLRYIVLRLQAEKEMTESAERKVLQFIADLVEANHYRLGLLLKDNLDRMDDRELVRMLEEKVGGDLQWIRVNGALCGFIIGLILTSIQWL